MSLLREVERITDFDIVTIANTIAAKSAIIEPLPAPVSADMYSPPITDNNPKNWVQRMQDLKLFPIC